MRYFPHISIGGITFLFFSGLSYYLFASFNWGAGEIVMHIHLWFGFFFAIYILLSVPKHYKNNKAKCKDKVFIYVSYLLVGTLGISLISGLVHFVPYISYFIQPIYYQFETYDIVSLIHLLSAILTSVLLIRHLFSVSKGVK